MLPLPRAVRIKLGRHAFSNRCRKTNLVEIEIAYGYNDHGQLRFSAMGFVWNFTRTRCVCSGQCLDTIYERCVDLRHNKLFMDIYGLWKRNHLNDCSKYVNREQKQLIEEFNKTEQHSSEEEIAYLKSIGKLSYVIHEKVCEYEQEWYYLEISDEDKQLIEDIISIGEEATYN